MCKSCYTEIIHVTILNLVHIGLSQANTEGTKIWADEEEKVVVIIDLIRHLCNCAIPALD